jgi:organic hydroperoxide reductase OsmC/OhrA
MEATPRVGLECGPPAGLDDAVEAWSAERMLLSSLGLCLLTTFEAFAARNGIDVLAWDARASGDIERAPEGMMFTSILLEIDLELAGNLERVEATLEHAKQYCLVVNSLRVPVVIETQLRTSDGRPYPLPAELSGPCATPMPPPRPAAAAPEPRLTAAALAG